jgi:hypothetical protein
MRLISWSTVRLFTLMGMSVPALAASQIAIGPNAVVPDGAPLPVARATANAACDNLGECGRICPSGGSLFIGDFAYDLTHDRFAVIDVSSSASIFWMDAQTCKIGNYGAYVGDSQRGCAIDNDDGSVYTASWSDDTIWHLDSSFNVLGSQYFGEGYAGLAVDEANRLLYASTNGDPDELIEYAIQGDGSVSATGNRWMIPWATFSNGFSTASLEFDDCSSTFMIINQDSNSMEYFQLQGGNLVSVGACTLPVGFGWGFGLNFATVELKVADIASFFCDFPVISVAPDEMICGGGELPDFVISYDPLASAFIGSGGGPIGAVVRNNTDMAHAKALWVTVMGQEMPLGNAVLFPPGPSTFYAGVEDQGIQIPAGDYTAYLNLGDAVGGPADATTEFTAIINEPGMHPPQ